MKDIRKIAKLNDEAQAICHQIMVAYHLGENYNGAVMAALRFWREENIMFDYGQFLNKQYRGFHRGGGNGSYTEIECNDGSWLVLDSVSGDYLVGGIGVYGSNGYNIEAPDEKIWLQLIRGCQEDEPLFSEMSAEEVDKYVN